VSGGYLRQLQLTKQLEQQAKEAARNREAAERKLEEAEKIVTSAKQIGANAAEAEKSLVEGRSAFQTKDYKGALGLASRAIEVAEEIKGEMIASIASSAQELLKLIGAGEGDSSTPYIMIEKARGLIAEGDLEQAYRVASVAWNRAEQLFNGHMADGLGRAQSLLLLAEREGIDTSGEKEILSQARKALERNDHHHSIELLRKCLDMVSDDLRMCFRSRAEGMRRRVEQARELSDELKQVLDTLTEAEEELEEGGIEDAYSKLTIAEGDLRKGFSKGLLSRFDSLERRLQLIARLRKDPSPVSKVLSEGRESIRSQDYPTGLQMLRTATKLSREIELDILVERIATLRGKLMIAKRVGKDLSRPLEALEDARQWEREGKFEEALDAVEDANEVLEDLLREFRKVERELSRVESLSSFAAQLDAEMGPSRERMRRAKSLALMGRIEEALREISSAQSDLNWRIQQALGSRIMEAEMMLTSALRMDLDVSRENEIIEDLSTRVRKGDYPDALSRLNEVSSTLDERLSTRARDQLNRARKLLERFESKTDISSARQLLLRAERSFEEGDRVGSFELAAEAMRTLESDREEILEQSMTEAHLLLGIMGKLGVQSVTLKEKLLSIRRLRDDGKTMAAVEAADEVIHFAQSIIREELEERLGEISVSISTARRRGVETSAIDRLLEEVSVTIERAEMEKAFQLTEELEGLLEETINKHGEVEDKLAAIEEILSEARGARLQVSGPSMLLEQAKASFGRGEYDQAMDTAQRACEMIEKLISPFMSSRKIQEAKSLMAIVKRLGSVPAEIEESIQRADKLVEEREHAQALELAKEAIHGLRDRIRGSIEVQIREARELVLKATELSTDVTSLSAIINKAEGLLHDDRLTDAMRAIGLVRRELDQGLEVERRAAEGIERAGSVISSVRKMGLTPKDSMELLQQAKAQHREGKTNIALELARRAADVAAEMAKADLNERMKRLEINYRAMGLDGPDLDKAIESRKQIGEHLDRWKFGEALSLLTTMEAEIERVRKQKELSERSLKEVAARVEEARGEGLVSAKVDSLLAMARKNLEKGAFAEAFSLSIRCGDELRSLRELHARRSDELRSLRDEISMARKEGVEVSEIGHLIEEAERHLEGLEFEEVSLALRRARNALRRKLGALFEQRTEELGSLLSLAEEVGVERSSIPSHIVTITQEQPKKADIAMMDRAKKGLDELRDIVTGKLMERRQELEGRIQMAANSGVDTRLSEDLLAKAGDSLSSGRLAEAHRLLSESEEGIGVAVEERKEYIDLRLRCESYIEVAKRNGLAMEEVVKRFHEAEARRREDHTEAVRLMREALAMAEQEATSYLPQILADIDLEGEPRSGEWVRGVIRLHNKGRSIAREVSLNFLGEVEVRGLEVIRKLRGGEEKVVGFELMPHRPGRLHTTLVISCRPVLSEDSWENETSFVLDVS